MCQNLFVISKYRMVLIGAMTAVRMRSVAIVLVATTLWGFIGVLIRGLSDLGLDSLQINGARSWISLIMLAVILFLYDRSLFRIGRRDIPVLLFAAAAKLMMDICYVQAQVMLSLSLAAVLLSADCYFTLILSFFMYRSGVTPLRVLAVFVGFFGCALMMGILSGEMGEFEPLGLAVGICSAVFGAMYTIGLKKGMDRSIDPTTVLLYVFLFGSFMILPFMDPIGTTAAVFSGWDSIGLLLILGFFFTLVPYYLYSTGLKNLEPSTINVLLFMEVAMAAVAGMMVYGEMLTAADFIGLGMILTSIIMVEKGKPEESD